MSRLGATLRKQSIEPREEDTKQPGKFEEKKTQWRTATINQGASPTMEVKCVLVHCLKCGSELIIYF